MHKIMSNYLLTDHVLYNIYNFCDNIAVIPVEAGNGSVHEDKNSITPPSTKRSMRPIATHLVL